MIITVLSLRREQFALQNQLDSFDDVYVVPSSASPAMLQEEALRMRLKDLKVLLKQQLAEMNTMYHPRWGQLFKAGLQDSRFAKQIMDYACLYTSRASNLGSASPKRPYRPARDMLPHDIDRPLYQA